MVEASRLDAPGSMLHTAWIKPGAFVVPYGTMSAVALSLTDIALGHAMLPKSERLGIGLRLRFA